ncbi:MULTISPECIES: GNAT family N-acetyltransferase [Pseudomonas]|uniref:GNAT family N-acetyltransferase n=1 Tax=Pseudomonas TaxID=286 RepID=UPI001F527D36|nr:GNAT family N-acetyltransferase [Pseudomonas putida]MCI0914134.1 GNAT family N-acetyltransferase [Pseudomonas putida]
MPPLLCTPLTDLERRLLDHFYRQHGSRMRAASDGELWVARSGAIIAGLSLSAVAGGQWLTGLLVAPAWRNQGVAARLVHAALGEGRGPTWLFCHPDLEAFYQRLGFSPASVLPEALGSRLARYQRSKRLMAMVQGQSSLASRPGNSTSV